MGEKESFSSSGKTEGRKWAWGSDWLYYIPSHLSLSPPLIFCCSCLFCSSLELFCCLSFDFPFSLILHLFFHVPFVIYFCVSFPLLFSVFPLLLLDFVFYCIFSFLFRSFLFVCSSATLAYMFINFLSFLNFQL